LSDIFSKEKTVDLHILPLVVFLLRQGDILKAKEFRAIREKMGLTQDELGKLMGTNQNTISRWEIGMRSISETVARFVLLLAKTQKREKRK